MMNPGGRVLDNFIRLFLRERGQPDHGDHADGNGAVADRVTDNTDGGDAGTSGKPK